MRDQFLSVSSCVSRRLGNGSSTSFWHDSWLNCGVFSIVFHYLLQLST